MNNFEFVDQTETLSRQLSSVGFDVNLDRVQLFARLCGEMQDLPRHLGQHSGGMVICQGRLDSVVPLENATMPGRVVVQWDKDDCADMGLVKVDLLGLGMMAALQDALALINGEPNEIARRGRSRKCLANSAVLASLSISRICRPRIRSSIGCCVKPTRSASSRSNLARRWRRFHASNRPPSTTSSSRSRSFARGPSSDRWCIRF